MILILLSYCMLTVFIWSFWSKKIASLQKVKEKKQAAHETAAADYLTGKNADRRTDREVSSREVNGFLDSAEKFHSC